MPRKPVDVTEELRAYCKIKKIKIVEMPRTKSYDKGQFKCFCGEHYAATASYVLKKFGCPKCTKQNAIASMAKTLTGRAAANKKTHSQYIKELKSVNPSMKCLEQYQGSFTPILHRCHTCKHESQYRPLNILRFGCINCAGKVPKTADSYNEELKGAGIPFETTEYLGSRTKSEHLCTRCTKFTCWVSPTNALKPGKLRCPICDSSTVYAMECGEKVFRVRGFERFALPKLLQRYDSSEIVEDLSGQVPKVTYGGHTYTADFYVPKRNLLIEVKSIHTLGLTAGKYGKPSFSINKKKKLACLRDGFKYKLMLMTGSGQQIPLPNDWQTYSEAELRSIIRSLGFKC